jgi:glutathione gamma-glutamylcysteinyltransferase
LLLQEEVLKQVQETGLFKHVAAFLSSANSCCQNLPPLSHQDDFPDIAARVCCLGAEMLAGKSGSSDEYCCLETCIKCLKANGDKPVTVFSGTVINGKSEQGVDVLVPSSRMKQGCCCSVSSNYSGIHSASNDVLTALLLALPPETWSGIKNEKLLQDISSLILTESLPTLLQEEVINLSWTIFDLANSRFCCDGLALLSGICGCSKCYSFHACFTLYYTLITKVSHLWYGRFCT